MKGAPPNTIVLVTTAATNVSWFPPCRIAIIEVAVCASGACTTAGADSAGVLLMTASNVNTIVDAPSENYLAYVPLVTQAGNLNASNSITAKVYREMAPGQELRMWREPFSAGSEVQACAIITYIQL